MADTVNLPQPAPVCREWDSAEGGLVIYAADGQLVREPLTEHNAVAHAYLAKCAESDARLTSWAECRDLLSKARAEVEVLAKNNAWLNGRNGALTARAEAAEARAAKLLAALGRYGRHIDGCRPDMHNICRCGLAAAKGEK